MGNEVYLTRAGFHKLQTQLESLKTTERQKIAKAINGAESKPAPSRARPALRARTCFAAQQCRVKNQNQWIRLRFLLHLVDTTNASN